MINLKPPSLRLLITMIVVIPIGAVSGALVAISTITSRNIAEDLGDSLVGSATARVAGEVLDYQESKCTDLPPAAVLVAGTDGIWEARNPQKEMYGKDRMGEAISASTKLPAQQIADALSRSLRDFIAAAPIKDDVTFVIVKLTPAHAEARSRFAS